MQLVKLLLTALVAPLLPLDAAVASQPSVPLRIVVPYAAGGLPDSLARIIGEQYTRATGRAVIVENKAGASGIIGTQHFLRSARKDGASVLLVDNSTYAINAAVYPKLPYKPQKDLAPITRAVEGPLYLISSVVAQPDVRTMQDFVSALKDKPDSIMYGSPGKATLHHLGMERVARTAKANMTHVPYKGATELIPGLVAGDVSFAFLALTSVQPYLKSDKLRLIAVGSAQRQGVTPDVPTLAESGFPGLEVAANIGFAALAGTPAEMVNRLSDDIRNAVEAPEAAERIRRFGVNAAVSTSKEWAAQLNKDLQSYAVLVREIGLSID